MIGVAGLVVASVVKSTGEFSQLPETEKSETGDSKMVTSAVVSSLHPFRLLPRDGS